MPCYTLVPWHAPMETLLRSSPHPVPAQSPFIPADAKIVVGAVAPAPPTRSRSCCYPGFEYRMLEWRHPATHEIHWRLERRKSTRHGEDDE